MKLSVFSVHLKYIIGSCNCISTTNISYAYDALGQLIRVGTTAEYKADGLRVQKKVTVSGTATTTNYILHGKNVVHMARGSTALHFWYDAQNRPAIVLYGSTRYAYVYNLQDGIVSFIDSTSVEVVKYTYDAWAKCFIPLALSLLLWALCSRSVIGGMCMI